MFYPKKIGPATQNMLLDVNFNPVTFAAWWSTTHISNDFWIENEECLVRVHVVPRRSVFSPSHWRTQNISHKELLKSRQPNNKSFIEELAAWLTAAAQHSPDAHICNGPSSPV